MDDCLKMAVHVKNAAAELLRFFFFEVPPPQQSYVTPRAIYHPSIYIYCFDFFFLRWTSGSEQVLSVGFDQRLSLNKETKKVIECIFGKN